jgi:hypothetical protein
MWSLQEQVIQLSHEYNQARADYGARRMALRIFRRLYLAASWQWLWAALTGRRTHLLSLSEATQSAGLQTRHFFGQASVPLHRIRGTEGRRGDYDAEFRPTDSRDEARWVHVATAWLMDMPLPPVDLIQVGDTYFVRDGHHRVSIARALGQQEIAALVAVWE